MSSTITITENFESFIGKNKITDKPLVLHKDISKLTSDQQQFYEKNMRFFVDPNGISVEDLTKLKKPRSKSDATFLSSETSQAVRMIKSLIKNSIDKGIAIQHPSYVNEHKSEPRVEYTKPTEPTQSLSGLGNMYDISDVPLEEQTEEMKIVHNLFVNSSNAIKIDNSLSPDEKNQKNAELIKYYESNFREIIKGYPPSKPEHDSQIKIYEFLNLISNPEQIKNVKNKYGLTQPIAESIIDHMKSYFEANESIESSVNSHEPGFKDVKSNYSNDSNGEEEKRDIPFTGNVVNPPDQTSDSGSGGSYVSRSTPSGPVPTSVGEISEGVEFVDDGVGNVVPRNNSTIMGTESTGSRVSSNDPTIIGTGSNASRGDLETIGSSESNLNRNSEEERTIDQSVSEGQQQSIDPTITGGELTNPVLDDIGEGEMGINSDTKPETSGMGLQQPSQQPQTPGQYNAINPLALLTILGSSFRPEFDPQLTIQIGIEYGPNGEKRDWRPELHQLVKQHGPDILVESVKEESFKNFHEVLQLFKKRFVRKSGLVGVRLSDLLGNTGAVEPGQTLNSLQKKRASLVDQLSMEPDLEIKNELQQELTKVDKQIQIKTDQINNIKSQYDSAKPDKYLNKQVINEQTKTEKMMIVPGVTPVRKRNDFNGLYKPEIKQPLVQQRPKNIPVIFIGSSNQENSQSGISSTKFKTNVKHRDMFSNKKC